MKKRPVAVAGALALVVLAFAGAVVLAGFFVGILEGQGFWQTIVTSYSNPRHIAESVAFFLLGFVLTIWWERKKKTCR